MHSNILMDDWLVYLIVFGAVALLLLGKFLLVYEKKKK